MVEVIPAVMPFDHEDLLEKMSHFSGVVPFVQIDVMDGLYVDSRSWPYTEGGPQEFATYSTESEGFPYWKELDFSVDLMVKNPLYILDDWIRAGATRLIVHAESTPDVGELIDALEDKLVAETDVAALGIEIVLAMKADSPNELIEPHLDRVSGIQCMGVQEIGRQGEPFYEKVLEKVSYFREKSNDLRIAVDGGVNFDTAPGLIDAGANILVVGSILRDSDDVLSDIETFKSFAE